MINLFSMIKSTFKADSPPPVEEEVTQSQKAVSGVAGASSDPRKSDNPKKIHELYRMIRKQPTVALARAIAALPLQTAEYAVSVDDESDARQEEARALVDKMMRKIWPTIQRDLVFAQDFGWAGFEQIFDMMDNRVIVSELKYLNPDITRVLRDKDTGRYQGLKNGKETILDTPKALLLVHQQEGQDYYGVSRLELVRPVWEEMRGTKGHHARYLKTASAPIPMVEYPMGRGFDRNGTEQDNYDLARQVLRTLGSGDGVAMPNTLSEHALELFRAGVSGYQVKSWNIDHIETRGGYSTDFLDTYRYQDTLIMRAYLVPERAALEGQFGTKAEAGEHGDLLQRISSVFISEVLRSINEQVINPVLAYNFGEDMVGRVYLDTVGTDPKAVELMRELVKLVYGNPNAVDLTMASLDMDSIIDKAGIPRSAETPDIDPAMVKPSLQIQKSPPPPPEE